MPLIIKKGDLTAGHLPDAQPVTAESQIALGKVYINNLPVIVTGDSFSNHGIIVNHTPVAGIGSPNVFAAGAPVWRQGDPTLCGDIGNTVFGTVYAN